MVTSHFFGRIDDQGFCQFRRRSYTCGHANPGGLVLFSSQDPARVWGNVKAFLEPDFSPAQIVTFGELVSQEPLRIVPPR